MRQVRIWVHPSFKKQLKKEAAEKDCSILKLTEEKAKDELEEFSRKRKAFDFRIR